jgi:hypothetical protein
MHSTGVGQFLSVLAPFELVILGTLHSGIPSVRVEQG